MIQQTTYLPTKELSDVLRDGEKIFHLTPGSHSYLCKHEILERLKAQEALTAEAYFKLVEQAVSDVLSRDDSLGHLQVVIVDKFTGGLANSAAVARGHRDFAEELKRLSHEYHRAHLDWPE